MGEPDILRQVELQNATSRLHLQGVRSVFHRIVSVTPNAPASLLWARAQSFSGVVRPKARPLRFPDAVQHCVAFFVRFPPTRLVGAAPAGQRARTRSVRVRGMVSE